MKDKTAARRQRETEREEALRRAPVYGAFAALLTLIGAGGLLIGYYIGGSSLGFAVAGGATVLKGSLIGVVIEIVRGSIPMPMVFPLYRLSEVFPLFLYLAVLFLVAAIGLSFLMTIGALLCPRAARKLCLRIGKLLLLGYAFLFFGNFVFLALLQGRFDARLFDVPTAIVLGLLLLFLLFLSLMENRGKGAWNLLFLVLSVCPVVALCLPSSPLSADVEAVVLLGGTHGEAARTALLLLCGVSLFNLLFSLLRLHVKRGFFFDFVRFSAQLAAEVLLCIAYEDVFGSFTKFFTAQPLSAALLFSSALLAVVSTLLSCAVSGRKRGAKRQQKPQAEARRERTPAKAYEFDLDPSSRGAV